MSCVRAVTADFSLVLLSSHQWRPSQHFFLGCFWHPEASCGAATAGMFLAGNVVFRVLGARFPPLHRLQGWLLKSTTLSFLSLVSTELPPCQENPHPGVQQPRPCQHPVSSQTQLGFTHLVPCAATVSPSQGRVGCALAAHDQRGAPEAPASGCLRWEGLAAQQQCVGADRLGELSGVGWLGEGATVVPRIVCMHLPDTSHPPPRPSPLMASLHMFLPPRGVGGVPMPGVGRETPPESP